MLTKQVFTNIIQSCSSNPNQLKRIHALILTTGLSNKNSLITQLLENLLLIGDTIYARQLFDEMHRPRAFLWNTLIKGYVKNDLPIQAALLYKQMHALMIRPDDFTYPFVIKAWAELGGVSEGTSIYTHLVKNGFEFVSVVRTELVIMFVKFGELGLADFLFETIKEKDLVAWNAFIGVCVQTGNSSKALNLFRLMGVHKIKPDVVTIVSTLSCCGHLGCLEIGEEIYKLGIELGINYNIIVENARLDMYVKCGSFEPAMDLFGDMESKNVVSWSTMIVGYAMNGESEKALTLFLEMQKQGLKPNYVTYIGVLSACSHAGLVKEGWVYFNQMARFNIQPRKEHYACMVDLLGRSGLLEEAYDFIKSIPSTEADAGVWGALLGGCTIHRNIELGQRAADSLLEVAPDVASYRILLSNMYAAASKWDKVDILRLKMKKEGIKKISAFSSIESDGEIHVFRKGDRSHPQSDAIYTKLTDLLKLVKSNNGYVPETGYVFHDVEMEEKEASVRVHSEKLAVAFGLINVGLDKPIRVIKNLRICNDCHIFAKLVSQFTKRDIIMRDKNRFHHFRNGFCSCKDFW